MMSKDKPKADKPKLQLDEAQRVERVLNAAGMASRFAAHLPAEYRKELAELCSAEGVVRPGVRELARTILHRCGKEQKAAVEGMTEGDDDVTEAMTASLKTNLGIE